MNLLEKCNKFSRYFPNHSNCVIRLMFLLAECILRAKTSCIYKCRDKMPEVTGNYASTPESNYMRLIRFLKIGNISSFIVGIFVVIQHLVQEQYKYLAIDRTNWKFGQKNINLLTLGFIKHEVFSPLCWSQLDKRGNSNFEERKKLIDNYLSFFSNCPILFECIKPIFLADREFIGVEWIEYLVKKHFSFVIRLREKLYFELVREGKRTRVCLKNFRKQIEKFGIYSIPMELNGKLYSFVMTKNLKYNPDEPYIYFISDLKDAKEILSHYPKRWKIECCFKHLKTNGFNLEDTSLKDDTKIELMVGILVIVYFVAIQEGIIQHQRCGIRIIKYKNGKEYPAISVFRSGLSIIEAKLTNVILLINQCIQLILTGWFYNPALQDS